jgi:hypothetical protein
VHAEVCCCLHRASVRCAGRPCGYSRTADYDGIVAHSLPLLHITSPCWNIQYANMPSNTHAPACANRCIMGSHSNLLKLPPSACTHSRLQRELLPSYLACTLLKAEASRLRSPAQLFRGLPQSQYRTTSFPGSHVTMCSSYVRCLVAI